WGAAGVYLFNQAFGDGIRVFADGVLDTFVSFAHTVSKDRAAVFETNGLGKGRRCRSKEAHQQPENNEFADRHRQDSNQHSANPPVTSGIRLLRVSYDGNAGAEHARALSQAGADGPRPDARL